MYATKVIKNITRKLNPQIFDSGCCIFIVKHYKNLIQKRDCEVIV